MRTFCFFFVKMLKIKTLFDSKLPRTYFMDIEKPLNVESYDNKCDLNYILSLILHINYQKIGFEVIEIFFKNKWLESYFNKEKNPYAIMFMDKKTNIMVNILMNCHKISLTIYIQSRV